MAQGAEHADSLLAWQPGPSDAAQVSPAGALAWGLRRSLHCKLVIGYLWLLHLLVVEGAGAALLSWMRGQLTVAGAWAQLLQPRAVATVFGTGFMDTTSGAPMLESVVRQPFAPTPFFLVFYGVFAGGVIAYIHAARPAPVLAQLGAQCGAFAGRFLRLMLLSAAVFWAVDAVAARGSQTVAMGDNAWIGRVAMLIGVSLSAAIIDYARVRAVARDSRSMIIEAGRSARFFFAHLPRTAALEAMLVLAVAAVAAGGALAYAALVRIAEPPVAALLARQLVVIALLSLRVAAWGSMLSLYQGITLRQLRRRRDGCLR